MNLLAATEYARKHSLEALIVRTGAGPGVEEYGEGFAAGKPHALFSGTKSFWGVAALYAQRDGILKLDELVADTIETWRGDPWKRRVTLRMLLTLTAGFGFGGLGSATPPYERALETTLKNEPGTAFTYGGISLQVFGAVLATKLEPRGSTPHQYLVERVLDPAGVRVSSWRSLADGTRPLPTGAFLRAGDWMNYGAFVLREREALAECFRGTQANERYGLGWWLGVAKGAPEDLFYASGSGGQALYVVPSQNVIAVHFSKNASSWKHETFLRRLFLGA